MFSTEKLVYLTNTFYNDKRDRENLFMVYRTSYFFSANFQFKRLTRPNEDTEGSSCLEKYFIFSVTEHIRQRKFLGR